MTRMDTNRTTRLPGIRVVLVGLGVVEVGRRCLLLLRDLLLVRVRSLPEVLVEVPEVVAVAEAEVQVGAVFPRVCLLPPPVLVFLLLVFLLRVPAVRLLRARQGPPTLNPPIKQRLPRLPWKTQNLDLRPAVLYALSPT